MEFSLPSVFLRLIAAVLLLSGVADYSAFDVRDPVAPMDAAPMDAPRSVHRELIPVAAQKAAGQDDGSGWPGVSLLP
jgi:hypothetical protein